jgi:hypothetical protein
MKIIRCGKLIERSNVIVYQYTQVLQVKREKK